MKLPNAIGLAILLAATLALNSQAAPHPGSEEHRLLTEKWAREQMGDKWTDENFDEWWYPAMFGIDYQRDFNLDKLKDFCKLVADLKDVDDPEAINSLAVTSGFFPRPYATVRGAAPAEIAYSILLYPFENWDFDNYVDGKFSTKQRRERAALCEEVMEAGLPSLPYTPS